MTHGLKYTSIHPLEAKSPRLSFCTEITHVSVVVFLLENLHLFWRGAVAALTTCCSVETFPLQACKREGMEKLAEAGLLQSSHSQGVDNVYENMLERIGKSNFGPKLLTVSMVDALSRLVFLVNNKWKEVPSSHLTKKQFVICFHQLFCQTLLTCPNGAKTTKICIKAQNYA